MPDSLLRRIAEGDQDAIGGVLDRYGGLVWSLARRLSADPSDAEDGVQEAFIDIWKAAGRYDESLASEAAFIAMIARRRLIDRARKRGRTLPSSGPNGDQLATEIGQLDRLVRDDEVAQVTAAFHELRPEQQKVLRLAVYDRLSHSEIARETGHPLGTIKTLIRRGLVQLRERLGSAPDVGAKGGTT